MRSGPQNQHEQSAKSHHCEPVSLKSVLRSLLREISPTVSGGAVESLERLQTVWNEVVGEGLAHWTRIVRYRGGVLTVEVSAAPLIAELSGFARQSLIESLAERGLAGIHDVKFKPGPGGDLGYGPEGNSS